MMSMDSGLFIACGLSFVSGAVPFGWIIAKLWGVPDLRQQGSANVGATNVVRTVGFLPGALTFALDFLKGLLPFFLAQIFEFDHALIIWPGLCAVLGHCYSPFLKLNGGKGVSTMLGASFAVNPLLGALVTSAYLLGLAATRTSALGSLGATLTFGFGAFVCFDGIGFKFAALCLAIIVLHRHEKNWDKLLNQTLPVLLVSVLSTLASSFPASASSPKRIVALMPNLAEVVIELGQEANLIGAPEHTKLSANSQVKIIGGHNSISAEVIYALKPDLVLGSEDGNTPQLLDQLRRLALNVKTLKMDSLKEIAKSVEDIRKEIGAKETQRSRKLKSLSESLERRQDVSGDDRQESNARVFIQVGWDPLVTVSKDTFVADLIKLSGGSNVFNDAHQKYPHVNAEEVLKRNPQVILICSLNKEDPSAAQAKAFWSKFEKIDAVKNKQIHVIEGDLLLKPGFGIVLGVERLEAIFADEAKARTRNR